MTARKAKTPLQNEQLVPARPALTLVPPPSAVTDRSPLVLWHLLSLDAPTVACVWTIFIARISGLQLPWVSPAAMFVAVWMLYAADRLLDARPRADGGVALDLEERHRFHHLHRRAFLSAIAALSVVLAALLHALDPRAVHLYALLAALLAAWLVLIHAGPLSADSVRHLPKELAVGAFFPAAIFIPTVARLPQWRVVLLPAALLFAAVCMLNCLFLYAWENPPPRPRAHWTTHWACDHLRVLCCTALALAGLVAALAATRRLPPLDLAAAAACALSTVLLLGLHALRHRIAPLQLRASADLVLLTPLLWLPWIGQ